MTATTVMQAKRFGVYTCTPDTSLLEAARLMAAEDISALVVVDEKGALAGIITRTDLLRAYVQHSDWASRPTSDHMSQDVVTVGLDAPLSQVAHLLLQRGIHRVVVVREEGGYHRPMAVVSAADLVYHMVREHEEA